MGKEEHNNFLIGKELETSWRGEEKTISQLIIQIRGQEIMPKYLLK